MSPDQEETKRWVATKIEHGFQEEVHVLPENDLWDHTWTKECPCRPDAEHIVFQSHVYTHNAWDGREYHEEGGRGPDRHTLH